MSVNALHDLDERSNTKLNILVVDDDALNQRMMQLILNREGYNILIASNGMEAVDLARSKDFDIILMDLQMPIMDGVSASRLIRENETGGRRTFIVALTASYMPELGRELFEAGIDNYISKPFDLEHLREIIRYGPTEGKKIAEAAQAKHPILPGINFEMGVTRVGGSEDIYKELLGDFVQELPEKVERLQTCHFKKEWQLLSRLAHNLKGVSANLGALRLSEQAGFLEKKVDSSAFDEIQNIIEAVRVAADEFRNSASHYLTES